MLLDQEDKGTIAVVFAAFLYGSVIYLMKVGSTFVSQLPLMSVAVTFSGLILLFGSVLFKKKSIIPSGRDDVLKALWMGIIGSAVPNIMLIYAVSYSLVSNSFLLQTEVLFSLFLSYLILREKITYKQISLTFLSFIGIMLVITEGTFQPINLGDLLFIFTPLFYQFGHIVAKDVLKKIDPMVVVMQRYIIAGLFLSFISVIMGNNLLEFSSTIEGTLTTLLIGLFYAVATAVSYYGLKYINLSKATSIGIIIPLFSTILAIFILQETLSIIKIIGIIIVILSIFKLSKVKSLSR